MIPAIEARARAARTDLAIIPPDAGIAAEIARLRQAVGARAAERVRPGETIILGEGAATLAMARALRRRAEAGGLGALTVVTNALDVLATLGGTPGLRVILTSGEYQAEANCLVGPSLGAPFGRMRGDAAYLSVDGLTARFGPSAADERRALAGSRLAAAAGRCVALADHTAIGGDATYRIARIDDMHAVVTDDGALPADRQSLREAGAEVLIADATDDPRSASAPGRATPDDNARPDLGRRLRRSRRGGRALRNGRGGREEGISRDGVFPGAWDSAVYEGGLYGIPFNVDVWQFSF